jgi:glyoxylase-like metal-dependent hydrolase (beta-lactamase superfamily II)
MTKTLKTVIAGAAIMTSVVGQASTLYVFESDANGFNTKNYFYDTGDIAKKSIEFLRSKTESPITHLVITHPNPDKFNGSSEFAKEGAKVIASQLTAKNMKPVHDYKKYFFVNIAKMFTEATYPTLGEPDETFDESLEIVLSNGEKIVLKELKASGVSTNQTIALIPGVKAVVVGDLIHHQAHAWLEGSQVYEVEGVRVFRLSTACTGALSPFIRCAIAPYTMR